MIPKGCLRRFALLGPRVFLLAAAAVSLAFGCGSTSQASAGAGPAPADEIDTTLLLVGDAGVPSTKGEPVLDALAREASRNPHQAVIAFLGDNIYPAGLPPPADPARPEAERRLTAQIRVASETGARALFVPGNHDWARGGTDGWEAIRRMGRYVAEKGGDGRVTMAPEEGCPGPSVVDVGETLRLLPLDTQWWLHDGPKPLHPESSCPADSTEEVLEAIRKALRERGRRSVVVLAHHPLMSGGTHGGHFGWLHHVFPLRAAKSWLFVPLPILGSAYPFARKAGVYGQDLPSPAYRRMRDALESALIHDPPLAYAAGHDHNLQVLTGRAARYFLVSGGGSFGHTTWVEALPETRFARRASGYMRLDMLRTGRVRLGVILVDAKGEAREAFSLWLDEEPSDLKR